ncbi:MAG: META domain-containing protein [Dysgonomonas sp.]
MKTFKSLFLVSTIIIISMSIQSCKTTQTIGSQLDGKWVLKSFDGEDMAQLFPQRKPTLEIDLVNTKLHGNAGCNQYMGGFTLNKNKFSAPKLASTLMMCPNMEGEDKYLKVLEQESEISIKNDELIFTQNGKAVLTFSKTSPLSAKDLAGKWELLSIEGASANTLFGERTPTIEFNDTEMRVGGFSGCNQYGGNFEVNPKTIIVGSLMSTKKACGNMDGEYKFTQLLTGTSDIKLDNNIITLRKDGKMTLSFIKSDK